MYEALWWNKESILLLFLPIGKSLFDLRCLLKEVNTTVIALILKVSNPTNLKDFRYISWCNIIYKYNTKLIANKAFFSI
jgi:hypothetical protein